MANLRTNNLCGEGGRNAYDGSVFFDGTYSYLTLASGEVISGTGFGTGDFTIEFWINQGGNNTDYGGIVTLTSTTNLKRFEVSFLNGTIHVYTDTGAWRDTGHAPVSGVYEHIVFQRDYSANTLKMYANGEEKWSVSNNRDYDEPFTTKIGLHNTSYNSLRGYLSNLRICIGHLVYSSNYFTPPTSPLTVHYTSDNDKTVLLCCQDSDNPLQEATGKTIDGFGTHQRADDVELITNGAFSSATTGWTAVGGATLSVSSGQLVVTGDGTAGGGASQSFTTVIGKKYILKYDVANGTISSGQIRIGTSANGYEVTYDNNVSEANNKDIVFTATDTTTHVTLGLNAGILTSGSFKYDNVSVTLIDGSEKSSGSTKVIPPFGVDAGNTFNGAISMNSQDYMYFPTGRTEERGRGRAVIFAGSVTPVSPNFSSNIDYVEMRSSGVGVRFGNCTGNSFHGSCGSATRGFMFGGQIGSPDVQTNLIEFVTIASEGNSTDFGDLLRAKRRLTGQGHSNSTRAILAGGGGDAPLAPDNVIQFFTMATTGDATDFGDLNAAKDNSAGTGSPTRMLIAGGRDYTPSATVVNKIEYITMSTTGNVTDFGDLTVARAEVARASNAVRSVFVSGGTPSPKVNTIDFVTTATTGNATDFGDLPIAKGGMASANNSIIGIFVAGTTGSRTTDIQSLTIATTGNGVAFGDCNVTDPSQGREGCSDSHGGLS